MRRSHTSSKGAGGGTHILFQPPEKLPAFSWWEGMRKSLGRGKEELGRTPEVVAAEQGLIHTEIEKDA